MKKLFPIVSTLQTHYQFKLDVKNGPTHRRQVVNPRHQTPQGYSVAKPGTPLKNILIGNLNIKNESEGNMSNPIFKEKVKGQKHPSAEVRSNDSRNHHDEIALYKGISLKNIITLNTRRAHIQKPVL